jgi:23S rRNA pseudouridine1911/1915/1917 synthase
MTYEPGTIVTVRSGEADAGQRLDRILALHLPQLSRTRVKQLIAAGQVTENGTACRDPSLRVKGDRNFVVIIPHIEDAALAPEAIELDVRFEDAHLIVIDKPAGMVVHPAPGNPAGTLANALLAHSGASLAGIGGVRRPGIVHRLDKDTSGLIVVAKTETAHERLSRDFAARRIARAYTAFVWGVPAPPAGEIAGNIGRSAANRKKMAVLGPGKGKPALTRYRLERAFNAHAALLECRLATGRTHQIRVHLAHLGHPVIGDAVYGTRAGRAFARTGRVSAWLATSARHALHARLLGFTHPIEQRYLEFDSPLPADLCELRQSLELL